MYDICALHVFLKIMFTIFVPSMFFILKIHYGTVFFEKNRYGFWLVPVNNTYHAVWYLFATETATETEIIDLVLHHNEM